MFNSQAPAPGDLPSSRQLLRSTILSAVAAVAILVTVVLPSEYAIDPTGIGGALGLTEMGEIKAQLAEEAERDAQIDAAPTTTPTVQEGSSLLNTIGGFFISTAHAQETAKQDEYTVTLEPGQGTEVKLVMLKGGKVNFTWTATDKVNFDLHGDGGGENISYEKGRGVTTATGVLEAAFDGNHGWFWRNRTSRTVIVTLKTDGAYTELKKMM